MAKKHTFTFNRVFDEYALQEEIYAYAAQPMVDGGHLFMRLPWRIGSDPILTAQTY